MRWISNEYDFEIRDDWIIVALVLAAPCASDIFKPECDLQTFSDLMNSFLNK
jgi:hypothetical protein